MDNFLNKLVSYNKKENYATGLISLKSLREICSKNNKYTDEIYDQNVRGFLNMNSKPNKDILHTASKEPGLFHLYNNGITIVLKKGDPKIINGLQTTKVLLSDSKLSEELLIQVKVIDYVETDIDLKKLIVSSNSSNSISHWDLMSHDKESIKAEKILTNYGYEYLRLRKKKNQVVQHKDKMEIQPTFFAKTMFSMEGNPGEAKTSLVDFSDKNKLKRRMTYLLLNDLDDKGIEDLMNCIKFALSYISKHNKKTALFSKGKEISKDFNPGLFFTHAVSIYYKNLKKGISLNSDEVLNIIQKKLLEAFINLKRTDFTTVATTAWFGRACVFYEKELTSSEELTREHKEYKIKLENKYPKPKLK